MKILLALLLTGCTSMARVSDQELKECIYQQTELYGDLCAESSIGYEEMDGSEAFFQGIKCASQAIFWCSDLPGEYEPKE